MPQAITTGLELEMSWPMRNRDKTPPVVTDEQAMWLLRTADNQEAFELLIKRWEAPIFRLCARMVGDVHRGEDLKQEAFSRVFARRKEFKMDAKFSTWLWRIALNLCYDELRKVQRRSRLFEADEADDSTVVPDTAGPYLSLVRHEEGNLVRQALLRLDEHVRTAVVLRYCEGLKLREIAELLEVPEATIQSRIAAGLARLTRILHPKFSESPHSKES